MRNIWAVAINTVRQAVRLKIAAVFILLLLVFLPILGFSVTGDNTLKGRLQTFVSYGLSLTSFLLCLLTIMVTIYSISSEIDQKQIYTLITKPVRRFEFLLGKLLGVVILDVSLLALFSAIIFAIVVYMPKFYHLSEEELTEVNNEFYTARASLTPTQVDVSDEVAEDYEKLEQSGQLDQFFRGFTYKEIIDQLTKRRQLEKRAVAVGHQLVWQFHNIKPLDPNESLFVRFKYDVSVNPPDSQIYSRWMAGDDRQIQYGTKFETPIYSCEQKDPIRTFRELEFPAEAVAKDGYLAIRFLNVPLNDTVVIFPLEDGLELLYKADTFTSNFIKAVLLILLRLIFLACLGVLSSTFLSFPVAVVFCLVVFLTGTVSTFVLESFDYLSESMSLIYSYTVKWIIRLLPEFDKLNPTKFLVPGRLISWSLLGKAIGLMICVKASFLLLVGLLIFSFREIAKITV